MVLTMPSFNWEKIRTTEDNLWTGNFKNVEMDINKWINEYEWNYLRCVAHGCLINGNTDVLYLLFLSVNQLMQAPNAAKRTNTERLKQTIVNSGSWPENIESMSHQESVDYLNSKIVQGCERVMRQIIYSSVELQDHDKRCNEILDKLAKSNNKTCRLYCCGAVNDPTQFIGDQDERIKKVANIRLDFNEKWKLYSDDEKVTVNFLKTAINTNMIQCFDGLVGGIPEGVMLANFRSPLFVNGGTDYMTFDEDIFRNIKDNRILADELFKMIMRKKLFFEQGMQPSSYERIPEVGSQTNSNGGMNI